jgi:hypothetical protein
MADIILPDKQLCDSTFSTTINAPIEKVDIAGWLFNLPEVEYCRCCAPDHISCASTTTEDGRPMSINVEMIGKTLMIQHYVAEVASPALCRLVSISDAFAPNGRTRVQVIWTLSVDRIDERSCRYTNSVVAHPTQEFMKFIAADRVGFEQAAEARQHAGCNHNRRETPLIAASIERVALGLTSRSLLRWPRPVEPVRDILGGYGVQVVA